MTSLSALHEGSADDPQMAAEPTYAEEIRKKGLWQNLGFCPNWQNSTTQRWASKKNKIPLMFTFYFLLQNSKFGLRFIWLP